MTLPYYPFYWGDYSAKTFNLSVVEHGIYMLFLRHIYTTGQGIPDKHRLSIAKATLPEYEQSVAFVLDSFFVRVGDEWVNERAKEVMQAQDDKHQKLVIAGKKGGKAGLNHPKASLKPPPKQPEPKPEPNNSNTLVVSDDKTNDESDFQELWKVYPQRLGDRGKKIAVKSYRAARKRASHDQIMKGVKAYADFCVLEQKINTPYVKLAATWLNQDGWQEDYIPSDPKLAKAEAARRAIELHNATSTKDKPQWD